MRDLAQRLLEAERAKRGASYAHTPAVVQVLQRLRESLTRFAGADGFTALLARAVVLARADVAALNGVRVGPSGALEGLDAMAGDAESETEASLAIATHLIALLITFIGESLTVRLVREAWPDAS